FLIVGDKFRHLLMKNGRGVIFVAVVGRMRSSAACPNGKASEGWHGHCSELYGWFNPRFSLEIVYEKSKTKFYSYLIEYRPRDPRYSGCRLFCFLFGLTHLCEDC